MKLKRVLASILALTMMFSMMSFSVSAENTVSVWDGTIDRTWYDANPTADSYTITTAAQFAGIADICNTVASNTGVHPFKGQTIYLGVDINLNGNNFSPIGDASGDHRYFYGSFDGQGHTISNIKIESGSAKYVGLFGKTGNPSYNQTFEDVTLENVTVLAEGAQFVGGLIGRADKSVVTNVNVTGEINISGDRFVGGILGHSYAQISDCSVEASGTINANTWQAGGLVGTHYAADGASVSNCSVNGGASDLAVTSYYAAAGGVIGAMNLVDGVEAVIDGITVENVSVEADSTDYGSGLALVASGYSATNATVSNVTTTLANEETVPADVEATLNGEYCISFYDAVKNANAGDEIGLLTDVTYDVWASVWNKDGITINGNDNTITVNKVDSNVNGGAMLLKASNLTINDLNVVFPDAPTPERERLASMYSGSLNNVNVTGGAHGVTILGEGNVVIDDCEFSGLYGWAIETEGRSTSENASLTISNSTFDDKAIIIRGKNTTFADNAIANAGEGVNVLGDAVITGNDFGESTLGIDQGRTVTIENNNIKNVDFPNWFGVADEDYSALTVESNTLSGEAVAAFNEKLDEEVVSVDPVAKVNDKAYYGLADAVAALEEGDTLKIASGRYDGFDVLVDNVTITGMTADAEITINSIPGNAFIGINAEGVSVEGLKFIIPEDCQRTGDWLDGFDAVIGYWSNNFNAGSNVTTGYNVEDCYFVNEHPGIGVALFNFSSFEIVNNTFENFNVGIHTMSDGSAMGNVVISDNTFIKVNEPVNVYWGLAGDDNNSIAIKDNDFVSTKDADKIKITVHDYASHEVGETGIDEIDLSGNTYATATEVVLVDASVSVAEDVKEELANVDNVVVDEKYATVARVGNDKYFTTLDAAIAGAAGEKITLLANAELNTKLNNATINIDLNGYKMDVNVGANYIIGKNSISNGTVDISKASSSQNIFGLAQYQTPATTLTMDKVNFIGDGFNSGYAVFEIGNSGADVALTVTNSTIDLKNDNADQGGFVKGYGPNCVLTITNTEVNLDNTDMFNVNVAANITDSEFTISNLSDTAFRNLGGTIDNSVISVTNSSNGIRNSTAGYNLAVTNNSSIKISGSTNTEAGKVGDLVLAAGNKVDVDATSELLVETSTVANADDVAGNVISKADAVYVQYKKIDSEEGTAKYEIVLAAANAEKINELASADLTFNFVGTPVTGGAMNYIVAPAEGVSLTQLGHRFMFNYDGVTKYEESGAAIVIGTITIDGYGSYTLATADSKYNAVYATEIRDNLVDGFTAAGELIINRDMIANDGMVGKISDGEIAVPTRELTINIDFPNAIEYKGDVAYQDMKVEITGNIEGVNKTVKYDLGELNNGSYVVTEDKLVLNNAYTVTVSGAGYRTARYTVTMTEDKTLRFWNNVMDEAQFVEIGKDSSKVNVTFLAGDIVKDNNINIYDLSAVVSYFGTEDCVNKYPEYAKYDLNRDGVIDSKDVAYVLVSWNN